MKSFLTPSTTIFFLVCLTVLCPAIRADTQSDSDLRKQNQRLTTQVEDLQQELKAAQDKSRQLEERIAQLEGLLASARRSIGAATQPAQTAPQETVTVDESVPSASPRALFKALLASYENATADLEMGRPGDGKRRAYMKKLEAWKGAVDREFRGPITWHVRVIDSRMQDINDDRAPEHIATLAAVDSQTSVQLGEPFDVHISQTLASQLAELDERGELDVMVLRGILIPDVRINQQRDTRGSFDNPPFIGPFAEFTYAVEVKSLRPAEEPAPPDEEGTQKSKSKPASATQPAREKP